jgi:hypothetical protein
MNLSASQTDVQVDQARSFRRWISGAALVVCLVGCLVASILMFGKVKYAGEDSWYPMARALEVIKASSNGHVYDTLFFQGHVKFQYPPSALFSIDLLQKLNVTTAEQLNAINASLVVIAGFAFAIFARQMLGTLYFRGVKAPVGSICYLLAIEYYPNKLGFNFGQMQVLLGLLVLLACLAKIHERAFVAGCLVAIAATVKPQFALLGLLALWQRDWRFVIGGAVVALAAFAASILLYGWTNNLDYFKVLSFLSQHGEYHHLNQSINGIMNRIFYSGPSIDSDPENPIPNSAFPPFIPVVYWVTTVSSIVMISVPFFFKQADAKGANIFIFCLAIVLFTMASPIAWVHHFNVLLPAYVVVLRVALTLERVRKLVILGLLGVSFCLTAVAIMPPFDPTVPAQNFLQSHVFLGGSLLIGIMLSLYREKATAAPGSLSWFKS